MSKPRVSVRPDHPWWRNTTVRKYGYALAIGLSIVNLLGDLRGLWRLYQEIDARDRRSDTIAKLARRSADRLTGTG